jgi:hypothetical protein
VANPQGTMMSAAEQAAAKILALSGNLTVSANTTLSGGTKSDKLGYLFSDYRLWLQAVIPLLCHISLDVYSII